MTIIDTYLERQRPLIVDGALGTELERRGCNLADAIWSARLLAEDPGVIARVHEDYLKAGADCLITASYQATYEGFMGRGMTRDAAGNLIRSAVTLARDCVNAFWAVPENRAGRLKPLVAASVGPYGAYLADGSEFKGDYGLREDELIGFHRERMATLVSAGPDLLACETLPCLAEARALVRLLEEFPATEAWISFSACDGLSTNAGDLLRECAAWLSDKAQVVAVGVNCTAPEHIPSLIREIKSATDKPVVVYPNRGGRWDAVTKTFHTTPGVPSFGRMAARWVEAGAGLIGGCCETTPDDILDLSKTLKRMA